IRRAGRDDDGVLHRAGLFECPHHLRDRRLLLADRVVDADDVLALLIDDRVDGDGGLARLAVADDQLALAAADRHHAVDGLETRLQRLLDRLTIDDAGREPFDRQRLAGRDRSLAVDGLAERVDDAAEHLFADRHRDDLPGALDHVAFSDLGEVTEQHGTDALLFEVERDAHDAMRELEHLAGHGTLDAVHARDAIANRYDRAHFGDVDVDGIVADLVADDLGDLFSLDIHSISPAGKPTLPRLARTTAGLLRPAHQLFFHPVELTRDAAVVHHRPDPRDDAAEDRGVDPGVDEDLASRGASQRVGHGRGLRLVERHGRRDVGPHDLPVIHQALGVRARDSRHERQPIAIRQPGKRARDGRADVTGLRAERGADGARLRGRYGRVAPHGLECRMRRDESRETLEFLSGTVEIALLREHDVEQRTGVAAG